MISLLTQFGESLPPVAQPPQTPVSIIDVDRSEPMDMDLNMSDPCPRCGGFCMKVGDYVCWGHCWPCEKSINP